MSRIADFAEGGFLARRHEQLREDYARDTEATLHAHVARWHSYGFHDFTPEHQVNLWRADAENDPEDFVPRRGTTKWKDCAYCQQRGLPKGKR